MKLSDYAHEVPDGSDGLNALVEVLGVLHECMEQMDALPDVRHLCCACKPFLGQARIAHAWQRPAVVISKASRLSAVPGTSARSCTNSHAALLKLPMLLGQ